MAIGCPDNCENNNSDHCNECDGEYFVDMDYNDDADGYVQTDLLMFTTRYGRSLILKK